MDASGAEVEFTGDPIKMKQLTATFDYIDDIKWQDGSALSQEDFELWYKIHCDRESGATSFIPCDQHRRTSPSTALPTPSPGVPGFQDPVLPAPTRLVMLLPTSRSSQKAPTRANCSRTSPPKIGRPCLR